MAQLPSNLNIFTTTDGSPTLSFARDDGYQEKMHHSGGALSESLFIYHSALVEALSKNWPPRILSFGLGLGYNELLAIGECLKQGKSDWKIFSFESEDFLRQSFSNWLNKMPSALSDTYDLICLQIAQALNISSQTLRSEALRGLKAHNLELRSAFPDSLDTVKNCSVIFYDAFSNKMNQSPWAEETLKNCLGPTLNQKCLFTTYAATGTLNRGLKNLGFSLLKRKGFQGKRESTLAIRE